MVQVSNQQPKVWIDGHYVPASKGQDGKWYVEIDGKRVAVDPNDLFGMNKNLTDVPEYFVEFYDKALKKNQEKVDGLKAFGQMLDNMKKEVSAKYESLLSQFDAKSYKEIEDSAQQASAREFYMDLSDIRRSKTRNSNDLYSTYMTMFNDALDKGEWMNQLNLAEHVMDNLG